MKKLLQNASGWTYWQILDSRFYMLCERCHRRLSTKLLALQKRTHKLRSLSFSFGTFHFISWSLLTISTQFHHTWAVAPRGMRGAEGLPLRLPYRDFSHTLLHRLGCVPGQQGCNRPRGCTQHIPSKLQLHLFSGWHFLTTFLFFPSRWCWKEDDEKSDWVVVTLAQHSDQGEALSIGHRRC